MSRPEPTIEARLDLSAIERALRLVQRDFDRINATLETPRDPLSDRVVDNLLTGYGYLNALLAANRNPLAPGNSGQLLWLNRLVLFGSDARAVGESVKHLAETERRFYDDLSLGGIGELMDMLAAHADDRIWRRAARSYIQVLSQPQLFVEGNHRTGALIVSAMLLWAGKPPFVLTVENAKAYFDPSSLVKDSRKRSFQMILHQTKLRKRLAKAIEDGACPCFLETIEGPMTDSDG